MIHDLRNFGESSGGPRGEINLWIQCRGYLDAITFAFSLLAPIQAFRWFIDYGGRPGSGWVNRVTRVLPPTPVPYSPYLCAPFVQAKVLLMVAPEDEMVHANYDVARKAYSLMPGLKQWHDIADGHFGLLYHPGACCDEAVKVQIDFLRRHLDLPDQTTVNGPVQVGG